MVEKKTEAFRKATESSEMLTSPMQVIPFWRARFNQLKSHESDSERRHYHSEYMTLIEKLHALLYRKIYSTPTEDEASSFDENLNELLLESHDKIRYVDLFAGMGGTRIGFEQALEELGLAGECVFTSEIKEYAIRAYQHNFDDSIIHGDITKIAPQDIPNFDFLLAGFPCQPFSSAGKRLGFIDERGGLFFTIFDILKKKQPSGFLLENVEGLVTHDGGKTLDIIIKKLQEIGYRVVYKVLDSSDFGIPQKRRRVYIIGHNKAKIQLKDFAKKTVTAGHFIDYEMDFNEDHFSKLLTSKFDTQELEGKAVKDKRGGDDNIHSWDIELKGKVNKRQKELLRDILKKRRYKKWAELKGIKWMDGMPLTIDEIKTFRGYNALEDDLQYLTKCGYLRYEHPKDVIIDGGIEKRAYKTDAPKGYNIVTGKLSFPITKILDPDDYVPTIVATEAGKIAVATKKGVRRITVQEGLGFSGFPETYDLSSVEYKQAFDLLGNTVMPPVIKYMAKNLLEGHIKHESA